MKHGDKAKVKAAKAKTSGKEARNKTAAKAKVVKALKASGKKESSASGKVGAAQKSSSAKASLKASVKAAAVPKGGRADPEVVTFSNPAIENAFKRAVKKYSNAFRRLTD